MSRYKVTTEIKTPVWKKILRWFRIVPKLKTFELIFTDPFGGFDEGVILLSRRGEVKIIEKL